MAPELEIIAPWRIWDLTSRSDEIAYAEKHGIPLQTKQEDSYSMDRNLWHLSHEGLELEDPWNEPKTKVLQICVPPEQAPDTPTYLELEFEKGIPVKVNGKALSPVEMIAYLNKVGAENGVGVTDIVENRLVGMKSRGVYETPAGTILYEAHEAMEHLCLDRQTYHYKQLVANKYAELIYDGMWYSSLREALAAFVDKTQETVTGTVKIKLYKGNCTSAGTKSPYSLYNMDFVTFEKDDVYSQKDAEGFINLFGLPLKIKALMDQKNQK